MVWRGKTIVSLSREFLNTNGVRQHASAKIKAVYSYNDYRVSVPYELRGLSVSDALVKNMGRLNVCCQKGLSERFDASIGASTVLMPFAGKNQLTPEEAMVAKLPVDRGETDCATAMAFGYVPGHTEWSPYHGSAFAVVESLSRLLAVGANPLNARLTFQEYFERLGDKPSRWGKPAAALLGALTAQLKLGTPSIGGKDSMSGSFNELDVPPTLVSFALAATSAKRTLSAAFTKANSTVVLVPVPYHKKKSHMPKWKQLRTMYENVYHMICTGDVLSASVVHEGGAAASVIKSCFGNGLGFNFEESVTDTELFAPLSGSLVLELKDGAHVIDGVKYIDLGKTTVNPLIRIGSAKVALGKLREAWMAPLEPIFPVAPKSKPVVKNVPMNTARAAYPGILPVVNAKPRVFIPVFPGTNCEIDTARAFEKAGAKTDILVVRNLTPSAIEETIREMAKRIAKAQIVMLPGGFSGGDEPDGSGKFIATTFRNPVIAHEVTKLLEERDGLMLGICNGFQALIKLGLVPYGRITEIGKNDPTLTFNTLGRHVSRIVARRRKICRRRGNARQADSKRSGCHTVRRSQRHAFLRHRVEPQRLGMRYRRHYLARRQSIRQDGSLRAHGQGSLQERSRREGSEDFRVRREVFQVI